MAADPRSSSTHGPLASATLEVTAVPVLPPKVKKALNAKKKWTPEHERELVRLVLAHRGNKSDPYGAAAVALQRSCYSCNQRYLKLARKAGVTWKYSKWSDRELQQLDALHATHEHKPDCWTLIVAAMPKRAMLLKDPEREFRHRWMKLQQERRLLAA